MVKRMSINREIVIGRANLWDHILIYSKDQHFVEIPAISFIIIRICRFY